MSTAAALHEVHMQGERFMIMASEAGCLEGSIITVC